MNSLSVYRLKMNTYEISSNSDDIIQDLLKDLAPENAILYIFTKIGLFVNNQSFYQERYNYFYNLSAQIKRLSGYDYSEDDLKIYTMYATAVFPIDYKSAQGVQEITKMIEKIFDLKASGDNERYAQETVKYKLLHLYSEQISSGRYEDMKALLDDLNDSREHFESLQNTVLEKIN